MRKAQRSNMRCGIIVLVYLIAIRIILTAVFVVSCWMFVILTNTSRSFIFAYTRKRVIEKVLNQVGFCDFVNNYSQGSVFAGDNRKSYLCPCFSNSFVDNIRDVFYI